MPFETLVIEGYVAWTDRAASPYRCVPFQVPPGVTCIGVRYEYEAGNILDIGLVDPEIEAFPARRSFRGWSGSARREFFLSEVGATPGDVPGPIQTGTWQVIVGLHRIKPGGCRYRIEIGLERGLWMPRGVATSKSLRT